MCHPLYQRAMGLIGQRVYVYHRNGSVYHGVLTHATPQGMYLMRTPSGAMVNGTKAPSSAFTGHALADKRPAAEDAALVFWGPGAFFAWGALAGLGAAAAFSPYWGW